MYEPCRNIDSFFIAGFQRYDGPTALGDIAPGTACLCQAGNEQKGMLTFFRADPYAASPKDCLYCTGLIPPSDSFIRPSLYQWM